MIAAVETNTILRARYPRSRGRVFLRGGSAGLDWIHDRAPDEVNGDESVFRLAIPHLDPVQVKLVREDGAWMMGRNAVIGRGDEVTLRPAFDRTCGELSSLRTVPLPWGGALHIRVRLPLSYREQEEQRYAVLYSQDGQAVWSDGTDPFGTWGLDHVLDELVDVGALRDIIVVSIDTGEGRIERLSPVPDPGHGGGRGADHLRGMVEILKPLVDAEYRTKPERESTVLLGASLGGLFSMWAAWTRPDVFGGAICLSPSLWWADRFMAKLVAGGHCPAPRPNLYLDSGAAAWGSEQDASTRDGVHNARAIYRLLREHCYELGDDLYLLTWAGHQHDARSWSGRIAVPLQLIFPRTSWSAGELAPTPANFYDRGWMAGVFKAAVFVIGATAAGTWFGLGKPDAQQSRALAEKAREHVMAQIRPPSSAPEPTDAPTGSPTTPATTNGADGGADEAPIGFGPLPPAHDPKSIPSPSPWPRLNEEASIQKAWMVAEGPVYAPRDGRRLITLTFDDGPFPETTPTVLRILAKNKIRATFFVIGRYLDGDDQRARDSRATLEKVASAGHLIGNHTYDHVSLTSVSHTQVLEEIDRCTSAIERVTGKRSILFRPPFGKLDEFGQEAVRERGLDLVLWSVEKSDMKRDDPHEMFKELVSQIEYKQGGIVLMHDVKWTSVKALRELLGWLKDKRFDPKHPTRLGYEIVDLPTYLRAVAAAPLPYESRDELEKARTAAKQQR